MPFFPRGDGTSYTHAARTALSRHRRRKDLLDTHRPGSSSDAKQMPEAFIYPAGATRGTELDLV